MALNIVFENRILNLMPEYLLLNTSLILLLGLTAIVALMLYLQESGRYKKLLRKISDTSLDKAGKKAENIITEAQEIGFDILANSQETKNKLDKDIEQALKKDLLPAETEFLKYLQSLKSKGEKTQTEMEQFSKEKISQTLEKFAQDLARITEEERQKAKEEALKYQQDQLKALDENIAVVIEKTLSLVINKELPLKDHLDLIYESFEKAKTEKLLS